MSTFPTLVHIQSGHLSDIANLEQRCFEASAWSHQQLVGELTRMGHFGFLLQQESIPLGYVFGWLIEDECELLRIAVRPRERGHGYSHLLMTQFLSTAATNGARKCFLEVRGNNNAAITLYGHHHFQQTGLRSNYYDDGTDALLMTAILESVTKPQTD